MATKSSKKKSAPKKVAAKSKSAAKKTPLKKAKAAPVKKAKAVIKSVTSKKTAPKKTGSKNVKKKVTTPVKTKAKKISKVVNKKTAKVAVAKNKAGKPLNKKTKKVVATKPKPASAPKKANVKTIQTAKKAVVTPKKEAKKLVEIKTKVVAKPAKQEIKNDAPLKPVTKPILKKSTTDAAASQRNLAIRARYKKVEIEYPVHSAKHILFSYLSTSSGLSEWFADKVNEKGDIMVFEWDGAQQAAKVLSAREDHHIRFRWLDMPEAIYFEFRVETDEITGDLALIITDFCEDENSVESTKNLWNSQIDKLFHVLGIH
jgi:hypothetical protein